MKKPLVTLLAVFFPLVASAKPDYETLTIPGGKTYKNVTVSKVNALELSIIHESGAASIPLASLSPELQEKYNYDPKAAEQYRQKEAEANAKIAKARAKKQFYAAEEASKAKAVKFYPDVTNAKSKLVARMVEINEQLKEADDDLYYSPDKHFKIAQMAALELGIQPVTEKATPSPQRHRPNTAKAIIITEQDIKTHWLRVFPKPRRMARDYHQKKKEYQKLITNINAGEYDYDAKVKAMEWNIREYQRVNNFEMANQIRADLNLIKREEEARKARNQVRNSMFMLENELRNIQYEIRNMNFNR